MDVLYYPHAKGYLALPPTPGLHPAVIMIHEWWGLTELVCHQADTLAQEGYVVLAVDLYGDGQNTRDPAQAQKLMASVNHEEAIKNLQAAVAFVRARDDVRTQDVGCIGWCFGGAMSLKLALAQRDLRACVVYYGVQLELDADKLLGMPPVLGIFGAEDENPPPEYVKAFEAALEAANVLHDIHLFQDAGHAFANPTNDARYRPAQATAAWTQTLDFLKRLLT